MLSEPQTWSSDFAHFSEVTSQSTTFTTVTQHCCAKKVPSHLYSRMFPIGLYTSKSKQHSKADSNKKYLLLSYKAWHSCQHLDSGHIIGHVFHQKTAGGRTFLLWNQTKITCSSLSVCTDIHDPQRMNHADAVVGLQSSGSTTFWRSQSVSDSATFFLCLYSMMVSMRRQVTQRTSPYCQTSTSMPVYLQLANTSWSHRAIYWYCSRSRLCLDHYLVSAKKQWSWRGNDFVNCLVNLLDGSFQNLVQIFVVPRRRIPEMFVTF